MDIPTDVLVEILVRLPHNARLRARLVCRLWRDTIRQHTSTGMWSRAKILSVTDDGDAYFVDYPKPGSIRLKEWSVGRGGAMRTVGTCNGLICLCDDGQPGRPGGAIELLNPYTEDSFMLSELPLSDTALRQQPKGWAWHQTYAFGRHPTTGRYKVVHVPCQLDTFSEPDTVHVFTVGDRASWRKVHVGPGVRCVPGACRLTDVDGTVYWVTEDAGKIMSLELGDERVAPVEPLPMPAEPGHCRLTKVHGWLGVAVGDDDLVTVWVLEGERWSCQYVVEGQRLVMPYFAQGEYVLTQGRSSTVYRCYARSQGGVVHIRNKDRDKEVVLSPWLFTDRIFAYIGTMVRPWIFINS